VHFLVEFCEALSHLWNGEGKCTEHKIEEGEQSSRFGS
jgi:hypothetical protein